MSAPRPLSDSARKVQDALARAGFALDVTEYEVAMKSSAAAAEVVGCTVAQIAKSLVFRGAASGRPVLVVASGANRVSEAKVEALVGERVEFGPAKFVRDVTGFAIGGIPPVGHPAPLPTFVDEALLAHAEIWAAAGHPNSLFRLTPAELVRMTGGRVASVA